VCCERSIRKDEIAWSRYNSYLKLLEGDDENYRTDIHNEDRAISDETENSKDLICQNYLIY
jgi:ribosome biogenesis GTPase